MILRSILIIVLLPLFPLAALTQSLDKKFNAKALIHEVFKLYNQFDTTLVQLASDKFNFEDPTMNMKFNSKEAVKRNLIQSSKLIENWKSEIKEIIEIAPLVFDIRGTNSGSVEGKSFLTPFSTLLVFNTEGKVVSWMDHVDPHTFSSERSTTRITNRFIDDFFQAYASLDTAWLRSNMHPNGVLIDPTFGIRTEGLKALQNGWATYFGAFENISFKINDRYYISDCVVDIIGELSAYDKRGKRTINPTFSIILYLVDGKISRWTEHWYKERW